MGNHTLSHDRNSTVMASQITLDNDLLLALTGTKPRVFRSPGMVRSELVQTELRRLGMCNFFGNILPGDTLYPTVQAKELCDAFKRQLQPGAIVMLHDGGSHAPTVAAVPCMAQYAASKGYQMVTLSELMGQGYWTY